MTAEAETRDTLSPEVAARAAAIRDWLIGEARFIDDPDVVVEGFVQRLLEAGLPLDRFASAIPTLYAVRRGMGRNWSREEGVRSLDFPWNNRAAYEACDRGERISQTRLNEACLAEYKSAGKVTRDPSVPFARRGKVST